MATVVISIQQKSEPAASPYEELVMVAHEKLAEDPLVARIKARNVRAMDQSGIAWMHRPTIYGPPAPTTAVKGFMKVALGEINSRAGDDTLNESDINSAYRDALRRIADDQL